MDSIIDELRKLQSKTYLDQQLKRSFEKRVQRSPLFRFQGTPDHLCVFFVPFHRPSCSVFLGDHKKGGDWMPPGGHIEKDETPTDTIRREFKEELEFTLTDEPITLFNLTIKDIDKPHHPCKKHWDMWYLVEMKEKIPFAYCRREYHAAGWFPLAAGAAKIRHNPDYRKVLTSILRTG